MTMKNNMTLCFAAKGENEAFARVTAAAFITGLDPTISEITDIKTAVSEAVTNAIIHGYDGHDGVVTMKCSYDNRNIYIEISDEGRGIEDVVKAMEPLYTSKPEQERSGMGFTVMETFMDTVEVISKPGFGTRVVMTKQLRSTD